MNVSAKAVILELLAAGPSIYDKSIPVRLLVRAASVFDIAENSVRVAVVRLCAEGLLESPERGRYCLGPAAEAVTTKIRGWQTIRDRIGRWDGGWIGVFTADQSRTDRSALRKRLQALKLHGFQPLRPGFHIRPSNLNTPLAELRAALNRLGLEDNSPVFNITKLDTAEDAQARQLWDTESISTVCIATCRSNSTRATRNSTRCHSTNRSEKRSCWRARQSDGWFWIRCYLTRSSIMLTVMPCSKRLSSTMIKRSNYGRGLSTNNS